jgi:hypothetical protein
MAFVDGITNKMISDQDDTTSSEGGWHLQPSLSEQEHATF